MRVFGATEEQIAAEKEEDEDLVIHEKIRVWPENWFAANVFVRCKWDRILVGDKLLPIGISGLEIETVARHVAALLKIKKRDPSLLTILDDVRFLEGVAGPILQG